jgi:hypothetical protein
MWKKKVEEERGEEWAWHWQRQKHVSKGKGIQNKHDKGNAMNLERRHEARKPKGGKKAKGQKGKKRRKERRQERERKTKRGPQAPTVGLPKLIPQHPRAQVKSQVVQPTIINLTAG